MKKIIFIGTFLVTTAYADAPREGLLAARVSAAALAKANTLDVFAEGANVNGERTGGLLGMVTKAMTGADSNNTKDQVDRWINVRNPCSRIEESISGNSAKFNCALTIKYFNDEALVTEKFKYQTKIVKGTDDNDLSATLLSTHATYKKTMTEGEGE